MKAEQEKEKATSGTHKPTIFRQIAIKCWNYFKIFETHNELKFLL
jgi:hypothetical protein